MLVIGPAVNGARRWISIGPAVFQPSELAKLALAVWAAAYLVAPAAAADPPRSSPARSGSSPASTPCCCSLEPDLGTAIALLLMLGAMLLVAGTPCRVLGSACAIAGALGTLAIWVEPYRRARFFSFLHPWHDAQGSGFQIVQAMIGMGSGGIFGAGLGKGSRSSSTCPRRTTDMMLANIGEELGLIGITGVILAYTALRLGGPQGRARLPDPFGKRLAVGPDDARLWTGHGQHRRRDGARSADGHPAPVPLLRRLQPRGAARLRRDPP